MATGAAGGEIFSACIAAGDFVIERRPYHRNCGCALHKRKGHCPHSSKCDKVSYPVKRSWSEGSLSLMAAAGNSSPSPGSFPAKDLKRAVSQLVSFKEEDDFDP